ncbi:hypothetical protein Peur_055565 [Populus x canadensis]
MLDFEILSLSLSLSPTIHKKSHNFASQTPGLLSCFSHTSLYLVNNKQSFFCLLFAL